MIPRVRKIAVIPPLRLLALTVLALAAGCRESGLYDIRGKVVFPDGSPLTQGTVEFEPVDKSALLAPRGEIQLDGSFRASTHLDGDGAPPGAYRVMVTPPEDLDPNLPKPRPFDRRFKSFQTSGLEYTVTPGKNEFFTITVDKPGSQEKPGEQK